MEGKKLLFRMLLVPILFASGFGGLRLSILVTLFLANSIGPLLTLIALVIVGSVVFLIFRRIRPKIKQVWNFEYQFFSVEVLSLVGWYFLICFLAVTLYMIFNAVLFPFS
jgi:hypothetical protein